MDWPKHISATISDESLLSAMALGDEEAAVIFIRRYQGRVYGLALTMLGNSSVAEEVAQESLLRVWQHCKIYDPRRGSVANWTLTITRNLCIDNLRVSKFDPVDPQSFLQMCLISNDQPIEETAMNSEEIQRVYSAISKLSHEKQHAVVMASIFGYSAKLISEIEGIPLGTAKTRVRDGLQNLRKLLLVGVHKSE